MPSLSVEPDNPARTDVLALLNEHLQHMYALSPAESVHALDLERLQLADITFWTARDGDLLLGCGALKELNPEHGEVKSMRTPTALRGRGAGRALLEHILKEARRRHYKRLSLETGPQEAFIPAVRLYESVGFSVCGPFGEYKPDPYSLFMTLVL